MNRAHRSTGRRPRLSALDSRRPSTDHLPRQGTLQAILVERPDPDGRRWEVALTLLLEAGRDGMPSSAGSP